MATAAVQTADAAAFTLTLALFPATDAGICPLCTGDTSACQPDTEDPERLLEVCICCGEWIYRCHLTDGTIQRFAILSGIDAANPCSPPRARLAIA